jgi:hypothetical protein
MTYTLEMFRWVNKDNPKFELNYIEDIEDKCEAIEFHPHAFCHQFYRWKDSLINTYPDIEWVCKSYELELDFIDTYDELIAIAQEGNWNELSARGIELSIRDTSEGYIIDKVFISSLDTIANLV